MFEHWSFALFQVAQRWGFSAAADTIYRAPDRDVLRAFALASDYEALRSSVA